MRVPLSWLREYVSVDAPTPELADRFSVASAEVKSIERRGVPDLDGNLGLYLVGRVVEAGKHPNADRLQLCSVDVGEGEPRQIVCGAWNFGAGDTVAVALPGAVLPGGDRLERAKLRGIVSDGMILSERELALGPDHTGILVLAGGEPGTPLVDVLPLSEEVLEVEPTGNRPDLLSIYGLAREVAAIYGTELEPPPGNDPTHVAEEQVDIAIEDLEGCPRYIGRLFREVSVTASPVWLKGRLSAAGMRPISNVVDVTNYVMLALGNPLHAFDHTTLAGGRIVVRRARPGEQLRTLDGVDRELDPSDLVIADAERAVALAGIMGGEETEVTEKTQTVLLEAANFEPYGLLRSSERLKLRTEGSNRWEKGVDPHLAPQAAALATELLVELADAKWVGHVDVQGDLPERPRIEVRADRASEVVGLEIRQAEQTEILERIGFAVDNGSVMVPTWRARDVTREIDVVEEIARFRLDDVPFTLPLRRHMTGRLTRAQGLRRIVEEALVGAGFSEAYTPTLVPSGSNLGAIALPEPMTEEQALLRQSLLPSLVEAAERNVAAGNEGIALFELARVFWPAEKLPEERELLAGIVEGGFQRAKGAVETVYEAIRAEPRFERLSETFLHPGKAARTREGWVGELHPGLYEGVRGAFELDFDALVEAAADSPQYQDVITYPPVKQDLAFAVDEDVAAGDLVDAARETVPELREMTPFDVYRGAQVGAGRKSIAFRVEFQSPERTLTDDEAAALRQNIVEALRSKFGAELRA
ncbi:MAG TPA: phenylalanine--tRNA ligase subunit beta [Gaiellaceae bacterium]|nr:phenylalanine--tRNA ligase subunit beta [Gaiellaceae bacterium]